MSHRFGDVVVYQMGKVSVNSLVVQSNPQPDGEHLVVVYLDPALASNSMAGSLVDKAIAKAFPGPLAGSLAYGWKDTVGEPAAAPKSQSDELLDRLLPLLIELSRTVAKIAPGTEISPDGTLISANTLLNEILLKKPEPAPAQPSAADLDAAAEEQKAKEATVTSTSSFSVPSKVTNGL
jgi:hypothetical protein